MKFIKRILTGSFLFNSFLVVCLVFFAKYFILFLGGQEMLPTVNIINILVITVLLSALSNILGLQVLIPFGFRKQFTYTFVLSSAVYILFIVFIFFFMKLTVTNISIAVVTTELSIVLFSFYYCKTNKLLFNRNI